MARCIATVCDNGWKCQTANLLHGLACRLRRVECICCADLTAHMLVRKHNLNCWFVHRLAHMVCHMVCHMVRQPVHKPAIQTVFTHQHRGGQKQLELSCLPCFPKSYSIPSTESFVSVTCNSSQLSLLYCQRKTQAQLAVRTTTTKANA